MSQGWHDRAHLGVALHYARALSKDPDTQVGSVIVGPDGEGLCHGYNGFPRGIKDTLERLQDREIKLSLMVHAEMNAVLVAARRGIPLKGCRLYLAATDTSGEVWGGPPCVRCTVEIIQAGIAEVVSYPMKVSPSKWHASCIAARALLDEAGVLYRELPLASGALVPD